MKIAIVANHAKKSQQVAEELKEKLNLAGFDLDCQIPSVVITVGGDGTLLSAFHKYSNLLEHVRFIGVHTGHLGFYTDWRDYEIDLLVKSLSEEKRQRVSYPLLDVTLEYSDEQPTKTLVALNEATIRNIERTMVADVYIKDECFEKYRGDGLSVSTPTGSTAYSKSLGGAVINPKLKAIQMNEIASINNLVYRSLGSPLIIAQDEWIRIDLKREDHYQLHLDHFVESQVNLASVTFRLSKKEVHFASYRHTQFWRRVNDAFIGKIEHKDE